MSKVDWSLAPKWANHVVVGPLSGFNYWASDDRRIQFGGDFDCPDNMHVSEGWDVIEIKPQPKPWSGPEDGLPPVGTECETRYHAEGFSTWHKGICVAVGESPEGDKICVVQSGETIAIYRSGEHLRAIITQEQQRETAIRELMDIAQVDCRVTAARLVDAGFKREGV